MVHHFCDIEKLLFIYSKCSRCTNGAPLTALNFHSNNDFDSPLIEKKTRLVWRQIPAKIQLCYFMLNIFHFIGCFAFYIQVCILHSVKFIFHSIFAILCIYVCNLTFKFIFYSSLHFIQVCILFKFLFYSSLHFIQVCILFKFVFYSSLHFIQVCIFSTAIQYQGGFAGASMAAIL